MQKLLRLDLLFALALFSLGPVWGSAHAQVRSGSEIKIGLGAPLSGPNASIGAQFKTGAELAIEEINAAGGLRGQKITLVAGDDMSRAEQGLNIANKFKTEGVKFVIGHYNSTLSMQLSQEVYEPAGMVMITPASTNPYLTERGLSNVFRLCGREDQQGLVAANYILANHADAKIAIVHDKSAYGKGLADDVRKAMNAKGQIEVLYEGLTAGEKDFSPLVARIKASGAQMLFWGGLQTEGAILVRQMREQGLTTQMMGGDGFASAEIASLAGAAAEGVMMILPPDPSRHPAGLPLLKRLEAKKLSPEANIFYAYASLQVLKQAADAAQSLDPALVSKAMHSGITFDTMIGRFAFNQKGDRKDEDFAVYIWKKGSDGKFSFFER